MSNINFKLINKTLQVHPSDERGSYIQARIKAAFDVPASVGVRRVTFVKIKIFYVANGDETEIGYAVCTGLDLWEGRNEHVFDWKFQPPQGVTAGVRDFIQKYFFSTESIGILLRHEPEGLSSMQYPELPSEVRTTIIGDDISQSLIQNVVAHVGLGLIHKDVNVSFDIKNPFHCTLAVSRLSLIAMACGPANIKLADVNNKKVDFTGVAGEQKPIPHRLMANLIMRNVSNLIKALWNQKLKIEVTSVDIKVDEYVIDKLKFTLPEVDLKVRPNTNAASLFGLI